MLKYISFLIGRGGKYEKNVLLSLSPYIGVAAGWLSDGLHGAIRYINRNGSNRNPGKRGTAVPTENQYYPLLDRQGNVIGLFIAYEVDGMTCVDFVSQYAEEIDMVADTSNVCLVYDGPNIFLKSENELTCLYQIVDQEPNDDSLIWNLPELSMSEIKSAAALNLDSNDGIDMCADGTGGDVLLSVGKHTQLNDYTCWASSIWSILELYKADNYTMYEESIDVSKIVTNLVS